jgi:hypothetical protein
VFSCQEPPCQKDFVCTLKGSFKLYRSACEAGLGYQLFDGAVKPPSAGDRRKLSRHRRFGVGIGAFDEFLENEGAGFPASKLRHCSAHPMPPGRFR